MRGKGGQCEKGTSKLAAAPLGPPTTSFGSTCSSDPGEASCQKPESAWCGVGPTRLLAILQGLYRQGRLTKEILAGLAFQFLPIFAQRVRKKQEVMNRRAPIVVKRCPVVRRALQDVLVELREIPGSENLRSFVQPFLDGEETKEGLGDWLQNLVKVLVDLSQGQEGRPLVARMLLHLSQDLFDLLHAMFPDVFQHPESATVAQDLDEAGLPIHKDSQCGQCRVTPIVGPLFEAKGEEGLTVCGECFLTFCIQQPWHAFQCHLAPKVEGSLGYPDCSRGPDNSEGTQCNMAAEEAETPSPWPRCGNPEWQHGGAEVSREALALGGLSLIQGLATALHNAPPGLVPFSGLVPALRQVMPHLGAALNPLTQWRDAAAAAEEERQYREAIARSLAEQQAAMLAAQGNPGGCPCLWPAEQGHEGHEAPP